jgi:hypothetical protein
MLKIGDIVTNIMAIRANPVVCESRGWEPIQKGARGVVLRVEQTELNKQWNGVGCVYVDVLIFDDGTGRSWKAGNYHSGSFSKLI